MNVADLLPAEVPGSVRDAVDLFHQGHLITAPPVFYGAAPATALCPFTEVNTDLAAEWQVLVLPEDMRPAYTVVTSQTCDICEQGEWDNPFVQVSPVIDLAARLNADQKTQLRQHGYKDFVYLTRQPQPDGFWVADLRISLPLEKGALVGKEPIDGFDDEISRLIFGERVASRSWPQPSPILCTTLSFTSSTAGLGVIKLRRPGQTQAGSPTSRKSGSVWTATALSRTASSRSYLWRVTCHPPIVRNGGTGRNGSPRSCAKLMALGFRRCSSRRWTRW